MATAAMRAYEGARSDPLFDDPLARLLVSLAPAVPAGQRAYLADGITATSSLTQMMGDYVTVRTHFTGPVAAAGAVGGDGVDLRGARRPGQPPRTRPPGPAARW
ncbi:class I SAM-dependent methyltransferase [Actinoallomurus sp. CA-150999]|uniref:class I SAM-dependent methyltransferase n=1 Tax=Actinoallomurus sp. CA-150999 TaxID=3239887 RepID=UPI003D8F8EF7